MYNSIVIAIALDPGMPHGDMLTRAAALLSPTGKLHMVHVLEEVPAYVAAELPHDILTSRRAEALVELRDLATASGVLARPDVRQGNAASCILDAARDHDADLIMVASHRPDLRDYFIGSTAARVVRRAQCSVLINR